ncbi:acyltransferase [Flavobacterium sp. DSR3-2]|uniref:acyltransferase n=1 Tax=Flavobacterium sp. DSR3-2 TaxID=2804634 RepID=UPI003CFAB1BC
MKTTVDCSKGIKIGYNSVVNSRCRLDNRGSISIGNNISISSDVFILTADHDMNTSDFAGRTRGVIIDDYVWVGTRAIIMLDITIGIGAVVAAGSLVTKNVMPYQIVPGVPCKFIKERVKDLKYDPTYKCLFQ